MKRISKLEIGDRLTADWCNSVADAVNYLNKLDASAPLSVKDTASGKQIYFRNPARDFKAKIVATGPMGSEANYTDARYWVQRQYCPNDISSGLTKDNYYGAVRFTAETTHSALYLITTATNTAEVNAADSTGQSGTHTLPAGTIVWVQSLFDVGTPSTERFVFNQSPASLVAMRLVQTVGSNSIAGGVAPTWGYDIYGINDTGLENRLGSSTYPIIRRINNPYPPATYGYGYQDSYGNWHLMEEVGIPTLFACPGTSSSSSSSGG